MLNFEKFLEESTKIPKWKRAGPDGEIEIQFPTGRKFRIESSMTIIFVTEVNGKF